MKRIILLLTLSTLFTIQSKAFVSHTLESDNGHKYAFYKCGQASVNYELEVEYTYPLKGYYSYAAITTYINDLRKVNSSGKKYKEIQFRIPKNVGDDFNTTKTGTITAPLGSIISRIKLAVSGEMVSVKGGTVMWLSGNAAVYWTGNW